MKKCLILLIFLLLAFSPLIRGAESISPLLKCLAEEEFTLHKQKITGPLYALNQHFFNELAQSSTIILKQDYLQTICHENTGLSVSEKLLHHLLKEKGIIFKKSTLEEDPYNYAKAPIDNLLEDAPRIFFDYLSGLQSVAATPHCLAKQIPELPYFLDKFKYLESEIGSIELLDETAKIDAIFTKLKKLKNILAQCQAEERSSSKKSSTEKGRRESR